MADLFVGGYNANVNRTVSYLPDRDRISILAGTILMAFMLTPFVNLPAIELVIPIPGIQLPFQLNFRTLVSIVVAIMTATGANWLIRDHPSYHDRWTLQHWLLPALTAWVIGSILFTVPFTPLWWAALITGGFIMTLVLVAEYIVVEPQDVRYPIASAGLAALAYGLFLTLAITLHTAELRLFFRLPILTLASALVTLRVLNLRLGGTWAIWPTVAVALICAQFASLFHYWPVSSASYGLFILAPLYGITNFIAITQQNAKIPRAIWETSLITVLILALAIWLI